MTNAAPSTSRRIDHLIEAGVDLLLIETMNSIREAVIAAKLAISTGLPTLVSFVCDREGRILSGESVAVAAEILLPLEVKALGVNCGPAQTLAKPLAELLVICGSGFPLMAYGNIGYADKAQGWINTDAVDPDSYLKICSNLAGAKFLEAVVAPHQEHIRKLRDWRLR